jgi:hypothetical protein
LKALKGILILSFVAIILFPATGTAQHQKVVNLPKYDYKPYHFGFIIGVNQMFFSLKTVEDLLPIDSLYVIKAEPELGFNIGIVTNLRLGRHFDLRFIPTLSFGERNLIYTLSKNDTLFIDVPKKVESTYLDFPLNLKFKSNRVNNFRAYVLTGVKYSLDLASKAKDKDTEDEINLKLYKNDYSFEVGVGFEFYATFFKFGTELKMSYGVRDLLKRENNIYTDGIDKLSSKIFQISLTFE